ncbi:MAG: ABC transporter substrate-binding protein [Rhodospirillales bacterium]|nr:ABC transporter substrate-binding protein [Rhodospirillales bacterium]
MGDLSLTIACGPYDRMEAIHRGEIRPEGIDATYVPIQSPPEIFARMVKGGAFDVAEMSLSHYLTLKTRGSFPFIALPVFPSRVFRHGFIFTNRNAGITTPKDLAGKRIGVQEYRQTAAVWIRGILTEHYGVDLGDVQWVEGGVNAPRREDDDMDIRPLGPLAIRAIGEDGTLNDMLASGEIDALIGARRPASLDECPDVIRLFPNYREAERDYFVETGIFPIMHTLVMPENLYRDRPWIAESLYKAFVASKNLALERMRFSGAMRYMTPWLFDDLDEIDALFGGDPFPYGVEANRVTLDAFARYLLDQRFVESPIPLDELFTPIIGWQE